jgi:hypothetical protein
MTDFFEDHSAPFVVDNLSSTSLACVDGIAAAAYCKLDAKLLPLVEFEPETPAIPEFREQYARARAHQAEYFVEEIPFNCRRRA